MSLSSTSNDTSTISITSTTTRRPIRAGSPIATGTGTRGFCTSIRITRTCIIVTNMSTCERAKRPDPGNLND